MRYYSCIFIITLFIGLNIASCAQGWKDLPAPEVSETWVQPVQGKPAQPIWGHANGLRVGIAPLPGPRGLLRIYTPYLGHKEGKMINFIALEPIPKGSSDRRGLSELEKSNLDNKQGKRFWSANDDSNAGAQPEDMPAKGIIDKINGVETLTVYIFSEPFDNGAKVYIRLRFYENKPYEVEITTYKSKGSVLLKNFIVTATMGNYARLRTLYLAGNKTYSGSLWPDYNDTNFASHKHFPVENFIKDKNGGAYFIAAPDEKHPQTAEYAEGTHDHWKYYGDTATQYWYCPDPNPGLEGLVNGRIVYWGGTSPIPGGISFENFELKAPFENGAKVFFGVSPQQPEKFIKKITKDSN